MSITSFIHTTALMNVISFHLFYIPSSHLLQVYLHIPECSVNAAVSTISCSLVPSISSSLHLLSNITILLHLQEHLFSASPLYHIKHLLPQCFCAKKELLIQSTCPVISSPSFSTSIPHSVLTFAPIILILERLETNPARFFPLFC